MKMTVEDNKIVFRAGAGGSTVRYSLAFVKNHIAKLEGELMKFREYERLLTTGTEGLATASGNQGILDNPPSA